MNLDRWLKPSQVAVAPGDVELLRELATDMLAVVAADPASPAAWECAKACELAIATYAALAGDWSIHDTLAAVKREDGVTKGRAHTALAVSRGESKAAWSRVVVDVVTATRALRNLGEQTAERRVRRDNVLTMRRKAG